jgi:hypothetical protein
MKTSQTPACRHRHRVLVVSGMGMASAWCLDCPWEVYAVRGTARREGVEDAAEGHRDETDPELRPAPEPEA